MSGRKLGDPRVGDRAEYMAMFGLSRFAFVTPVPRQEDFGVVDFLCVLNQREGDCDYPKSAFNVQVKSSRRAVKPMDANEIRWITEYMDHPLFLCISDNEAQKLTFYSFSRIWLALFFRTGPKKIRIRLDEHGPEEKHYNFATPDPADIDGEFELFLGPPILEQSLDELEQDSSRAFDVLSAWIRLDNANIARRNLGRISVRNFPQWVTNEVPTDACESYFHRKPYVQMEQAVVPFLLSLGFCYRRFNEPNKLDAVCATLESLAALLTDEQQLIVRRRFPIDSTLLQNDDLPVNHTE